MRRPLCLQGHPVRNRPAAPPPPLHALRPLPSSWLLSHLLHTLISPAARCHLCRTHTSSTSTPATMGLVRQLVVEAINAVQQPAQPAAGAAPTPATDKPVGPKDVTRGSDDSDYKQ